MLTDPFIDTRASKTLERNLDKMPWIHSRASPDNLFGEVIDMDKAKGLRLKKKLRELRGPTNKRTISVKPSLKNARRSKLSVASGGASVSDFASIARIT